MELEMQSVKQDKAHASQLRGKLEVALATALREKKEFEEYKVKLQDTMADLIIAPSYRATLCIAGI